ncbi:hypothetical protein AMTRI_Chr01g130970 [Amborella trichopoda]
MSWSHIAPVVSKRSLAVHVLGSSAVEKGGLSVHVLKSLRSDSCKAWSGNTCSGVTALRQFIVRSGSKCFGHSSNCKARFDNTCSRFTALQQLQNAVWKYILESHSALTVAKHDPAVHVLGTPTVAKGGLVVHVLESHHSSSFKIRSDSTCVGVTTLLQLQRSGPTVHVLESQYSDSLKGAVQQ